MLVVTNRSIVEGNFKNGIGDQRGFGEHVNSKGPNELRLAEATKNGKKWRLELVPEPEELDPDNPPSRKVFLEMMEKCVASRTNVVFYVHGYNKTFPETLEQGALIEKRYGVEVVLFSWPSNPGGSLTGEYRESRQIAQASFGAFDRMLEKFGKYLLDLRFDREALISCPITTNLLAYSMGNYLFQNYVLSSAYTQETRIFDNIILCQADVDNRDHEFWVQKVVSAARLYVTINERDKVLGFSERLNPPRLGRELSNLDATNAVYVDFTDGKDVGNEHQLWGKVKNATVTGFFQKALTGSRGEQVAGLNYDARVNAFRIAG